LAYSRNAGFAANQILGYNPTSTQTDYFVLPSNSYLRTRGLNRLEDLNLSGHPTTLPINNVLSAGRLNELLNTSTLTAADRQDFCNLVEPVLLGNTRLSIRGNNYRGHITNLRISVISPDGTIQDLSLQQRSLLIGGFGEIARVVNGRNQPLTADQAFTILLNISRNVDYSENRITVRAAQNLLTQAGRLNVREIIEIIGEGTHGVNLASNEIISEVERLMPAIAANIRSRIGRIQAGPLPDHYYINEFSSAIEMIEDPSRLESNRRGLGIERNPQERVRLQISLAIYDSLSSIPQNNLRIALLEVLRQGFVDVAERGSGVRVLRNEIRDINLFQTISILYKEREIQHILGSMH
jgi:hypothetical protein